MGSRNSLLALLLCAVLFAFVLEGTEAKHLKLRFYRKSCPKAEAIVRKTVAGFVARDATIAAPLLRLHFHDCFVRGCDGSVLLNSTRGNTAEKDAPPNLSLEGYDVIDAAKAELEKACPGVVSCADIAALAARDGIALNGGPSWKVKTGRRDGRISRASEALAELPPPGANISSLIENFGRKKLNLEDLVLLSGGHTIGISHCSSFDKRLYNFTGKGDTDPSLDPAYVRKLKKQCKPNDQTTVVDMDPGSAVKFDSSYFHAVIKNRGLFESDAALLNDRVTRSFVNLYAKNTPEFFREFGVAMGKMGRIEVLTGKRGEIRKHCAVVNPR